jgi:hypothetical protein
LLQLWLPLCSIKPFMMAKIIMVTLLIIYSLISDYSYYFIVQINVKFDRIDLRIS